MTANRTKKNGRPTLRLIFLCALLCWPLAGLAPSYFAEASYGEPHTGVRPSMFARAGAAAAAAPAPPALFLRDPNEDPLPEGQTDSLYEPSNEVGNPPGKTEGGAPAPPAAAPGRETPASSNFSLDLPVVSLPGRGLDVSLALRYNSRLWHKSTDSTDTYLTYDVDSGWPAPGFRLGYGQMEYQGAYGFTLTDSDGTRHHLERDGTTNFWRSKDGTFITLEMGADGVGTLTYTDGTRIRYGAAGGGPRSYPERVTDRNGNFITIKYEDNVGPRISWVEDTMERRVRFYYDGNGDLASITAPRYDEDPREGETTVLTLHYATIDFTWGQTGTHNLFNEVYVTPKRPDTVRVVRYVNFPGARTGYRYDYSPYGMIRQVVQLREMQPAAFKLWEISGAGEGDGQWAATTSYAYPDQASSLIDQPFLHGRTDDWVGRTAAAPTYVFENEPGLSRVTAPDGSVTETRTITAPAAGDAWKNGLVEETTVRESANGAVLARTKIEWEAGGANKNPRPKKVWATDEAGKIRAVVYNLYDQYGNARSVSEHDFEAEGVVGAELRRTETDFVTAAGWVGRNLLRLPQEVRVVAGGAVASRTRFAYDETALTTRGPDPVTHHDQAYNPPSAQYNAATAYRGNLTTVTGYADAQNIEEATTTTAAYDVLGNVVEQAVNCCRKKYFTYTDANKFAYPTSEKRGEDPALQLTTHATYDFNTGVVRTTKDENDQVTTFHYDPATLRPSQVLRPGGGHTDFFEEDAIRNGPNETPRYSRAYTVTYFEAGRSVTNYRYFDGRGALVRTLGSYTAAQGWATADVQYDQMGRVKRTSNPYYSAGETAPIPDATETAAWTESTVIDKLGRVTEVTLPDGTKVSSSYFGTVTTVTDQAGRQRRQVRDALGRVNEVHEPDAAGNLGAAGSPLQKTSYEYDGLDNLKQVTQAGAYRGGAQATQVRQFKYDSLSRLTHQKQVEAAARLDDAGAVSASGAWTQATKYDEWGNVTDSYDARGTHTQVEYDTLNRVKSVTYSDGVTPAVTYNYGEARSDAQGNPYKNKGRLTSVVTAALGSAPATAQEYDYDVAGRVVAQRQRVGSDAYPLSYQYNLAGQLTAQTYPSGRVVKSAYDDAARLLATTNSDGTYSYASNLTYAAHGGLASLANGNGTSEAVGYNSRLQVKELTLQRAGEVLQKYAYKYGQVNQDTGAVDEAQNAGQVGKVEAFIGDTASAPAKQWEQRLSYDALGRLERAGEYRADNSQRSWQSVYAYDRFGNRYEHASEQVSPLFHVPVEAADVDGSTNRFTPATGVEYDYAGNVTRDPKFRSLQYAYDANGRQVWARRLDGTNEATATYDGLGQRVRTVFNGQARVMVYDSSGRIVAEYGAADGDGGGLRYVFQDHQGSTRTVTDALGLVRARRDYEPYGQEVPASAGQRTAQGYGGTDGTRQQFAGTERDEATGLDHTLWRKYEHRSGRWTSPDPYGGSMSVGDPQSFNRYSYVQNDPVNFIDPLGLNKEAPCRPGTRIDKDGEVIHVVCTNAAGGGGGGPSNPSYVDASISGGGFSISGGGRWPPADIDSDPDRPERPQSSAQQAAEREFRYQIWKPAYDLALEVLKNADCNALAITGSLNQDGSKVLRGINEKGNFRYSNTPHGSDIMSGGVTPAGTANHGGRQNSIIWLFPAFYNDNIAGAVRNDTARQDLTVVQSRALILLHELAHALGHPNHATQAESTRWNRTIADTCF